MKWRPPLVAAVAGWALALAVVLSMLSCSAGAAPVPARGTPPGAVSAGCLAPSPGRRGDNPSNGRGKPPWRGLPVSGQPSCAVRGAEMGTSLPVEGRDTGTSYAPDGAPGDRATGVAAVDLSSPWRFRGSAESRVLTEGPGTQAGRRGRGSPLPSRNPKEAPSQRETGGWRSDGPMRGASPAGYRRSRAGRESGASPANGPCLACAAEGRPPTPAAAANLWPPEVLQAALDDIAIRLALGAERVKLWTAWAGMARRDGAPKVKGKKAKSRRVIR